MVNVLFSDPAYKRPEMPFNIQKRLKLPHTVEVSVRFPRLVGNLFIFEKLTKLSYGSIGR